MHAYSHGHTLACSVAHRCWHTHAVHLEPADLLHACVHQICIYACGFKWTRTFPRILDARILAWAHTGLRFCVQRLFTHVCISLCASGACRFATCTCASNLHICM